MNAVALSELFETAPGASLRMAPLIQDLGADALILSGWLIELPLADDALCTACGDPHTVNVSWDEARQEHGGYCADDGGWFAVATELRQRFRFRHERLLDMLSGAFGLVRKR
ncbi:MAG: hypothetical protein ABL883_11135 [Terricaulis sp.]